MDSLIARMKIERKFIFAMVAMVISTLVCITMKYDGVIFKDIILGLSGLYLTTQAAVEWKQSTTTQPKDAS